MCGWFNSLRDRRGVAAVEFALVFPVLFAVFLGLVELGRAWTQSLALQKGVAAGGAFAARNSLPLSSAAEADFENLVKRGSIDPSAPYLVPKWDDGSATLALTTRTFTGQGVTKQVIHVDASVPYDSLFPTLLNAVGLGNLRVDASYEQAHIGS